MGQFLTFNAITANPVQFISTLVGCFDSLKLPENFMELSNQDWDSIKFDCNEILKSSSASVTDSGQRCINSLNSSGFCS